jgi:hypothetical protein
MVHEVTPTIDGMQVGAVLYTTLPDGHVSRLQMIETPLVTVAQAVPRWKQ